MVGRGIGQGRRRGGPIPSEQVVVCFAYWVWALVQRVILLMICLEAWSCTTFLEYHSVPHTMAHSQLLRQGYSSESKEIAMGIGSTITKVQLNI